jgi:hypothetical protein
MTRPTLVNNAEKILQGSQAKREDTRKPMQSIAENNVPSGPLIDGVVISP